MINNKLLNIILLSGNQVNYFYHKHSNSFPVLCFHNVSENSDPFYPSISPTLFKNICNCLKNNYTVVHINELKNSKPIKKKPLACITFDDGYKNYMDYALPILTKLNLPSNLNVITNSLDDNVSYIWQAFIDYFRKIKKRKCIEFSQSENFEIKENDNLTWEEAFALSFTKYYHTLTTEQLLSLSKKYLSEEDLKYAKMLSWDDVIDISKQDVLIGSQGHKHLVMDILPYEEAQKELSVSKQIIEAKIQKTVDIFAFPSGRYNSEVVKQAFDCGYKYLLLNNNNLNNKQNLESGIFDRNLVYGPTFNRAKAQITGFYFSLQKAKKYFSK